MPQEGALFPHLNVAGNITFGLARGEATDSVVGHWLDIVGLPGLADARPHQLSGGQQQRVALAARPRVVLLDEPFAALDAGLRQRVREDVAAILRAAGTTAVLVTHDQAEALSLADSVALLLDGTIAQSGPPADLYQRPATLRTARFVGDTVELAGQCRGGVVDTALGRLTSALPVADGPATAVLRPEQLSLGNDCHPPATVTAHRFYGADSAVRVVLDGGAEVLLRCEGDVAVTVGQAVTVCPTGPVLAYSAGSSPTAG